MINIAPVNEMIDELRSVDSDIKNLKARIASGVLTAKAEATNIKYLKHAKKTRDYINEMLVIEYTEGITIEEIAKDLQRN